MSETIERQSTPMGLILPITSDVAQTGLRIIQASPNFAFNFEGDLITNTNEHLARYISALALTLRKGSTYFMRDFMEGAAWTHLILRLQQQKSMGRLTLSQDGQSLLPFVSKKLRDRHHNDTLEEARQSGRGTYEFLNERAKRLEFVEPVLSRVIKQYAHDKLRGVPILDFIKPDEQGLVPNFLLPGAAELYFLMSRTVLGN